MRDRPILLACALSLATVAARAQDAVPATAQDAAPARGALAAEIEALRSEFGLPALAGALVDRDGRIVAAGVAGTTAVGGDVPVGLDAPWHLGSCLKAMTATLAAAFVADGRLAWDSSPAAVLDGRVEHIDPSWSAVTLEQLLSHRAGAPAGVVDNGLWLQLMIDQGPPEAARTRLVASILGRPTESEPGSAFVYSNGGYALVGAMLETVGGAPFEALMRTELFEPLGMTGAGFGAPTGPGAPRGHREGVAALVAMPPGPFADNPPAIAPAGTAHMPLADWARFVGLHLRRGADADAPAAPDGFASVGPDGFAALHRPRGDGYALGWSVTERGWSSGPVLTHAGSNTLWFCVVWASPDDGFAALACTNAASEAATTACDRVASLLIGDRARWLAPPTGDE